MRCFGYLNWSQPIKFTANLHNRRILSNFTFPKDRFAFRQACIATAVGSTSAASSKDIESGILKQKSDGWQ